MDTSKEYLKILTKNMHLMQNYFLNFYKTHKIKTGKNYKKYVVKILKKKILQSYQKEIDSDCLIHVIRKGFTVLGVKLDCLFLKPESNMNEDAEPLYQKNIFSIIRQIITAENNKPDIVLFLNGIPVATAELKNPATGQSFEDAITQYKEDRDPKDNYFIQTWCISSLCNRST